MSKHPNILFFFTDDQRYNTIHALGCSEIHTPNLDAFTADSITFTQAHIMGGTCGAVCMPSRAMLLTGRDLFSLKGHGKQNGSVIPPEHLTIPEYLRKNGYYTEHIGKWHQDRAAFMRAYDNAERIMGFAAKDHWYGMNGGHYQPFLFDFDPTGEFACEKAYNLDEQHNKVPSLERKGAVHSTDIFCDAAVDFIENYDKDQPFYLYLATVAPHDPRNAPPEFAERYSSEQISTPDNYMPRHPFDNGELYARDEMLEAFPRTPAAIRRHLADYYAMISHIDARFGDVIDALKRKGLYDDTIIVFSGDNGLALGSHGLMGKQNMYEDTIRVPLIIKPAGTHQRRQVSSYCYLFDVFPTICEMCGLSVPESVTGTSLLPVLAGNRDSIRDEIFSAYRNVQRALKDPRYKIIQYTVGGLIRFQLFDLLNDPYEMNDLSRDPAHEEILCNMRQRLEQAQQYYHDPLLEYDSDILALDIW